MNKITDALQAFLLLLVLILNAQLCFAAQEIQASPSLAQEADQHIDDILTSLSSDEKSALQKRLDEQEKAAKIPFGISLYRPTYILPFYFTGSPDQEVYEDNTPENQRIKQFELKGQFSIKFPLWRNIIPKKLELDVAYTQLSYWQVYDKSQFFRETNYEPELFFAYNFHENWLLDLGVVHQSNGRGGELERSWNRAFANLSLSRGRWLFSIKPWILIFKAQSSNVHNPDIAHYLGYERMLLSYKFRDQVFSLTARNTIESAFNRSAFTGTWSIPITKRLRFYLQAFSGYGQSLIEYRHYTSSAGIGLSLNDWI